MALLGPVPSFVCWVVKFESGEEFKMSAETCPEFRNKIEIEVMINIMPPNLLNILFILNSPKLFL
jgi:hypothetical protein